MPDTLFPRCQRGVLFDIAGTLASGSITKKALKALRILVYYLPEMHKSCLLKLIQHCQEIMKCQEKNNMDCKNLGIIFTPVIFPVYDEAENLDVMQATEDVDRFMFILRLMLNSSEKLFKLPTAVINSLNSTRETQSESTSVCRKALINDSEIEMGMTYVDRSATPVKNTTEFELAKMMAGVHEMPEGSNKSLMMKRLKKQQRAELDVSPMKRFLRKLMKLL